MVIACKINHEDTESIPDFLCRACHPELCPTEDTIRAAAQAERQEFDKRAARQELLRARQALTRAEAAALRGGNAGIETRKAQSLRAKILKLEAEIGGTMAEIN